MDIEHDHTFPKSVKNQTVWIYQVFCITNWSVLLKAMRVVGSLRLGQTKAKVYRRLYSRVCYSKQAVYLVSCSVTRRTDPTGPGID